MSVALSGLVLFGSLVFQGLAPLAIDCRPCRGWFSVPVPGERAVRPKGGRLPISLPVLQIVPPVADAAGDLYGR